MRKMRASLLLVVCSAVGAAGDFELLRYNHPGLRVDLGVGLWAWPLPMDFDGDGDMDLVVSCPDKPHNGTYFFENPGPSSVGEKTLAFKSARRLGPGFSNITLSWVEGRPRVLLPGEEIVGFLQGRLDQRRKIYPRSNVHTVEAVRAPGENVSGLFVGKFDQSRKSPSRAKSRVAARVRANQWKWVDYDGDGALDLAVGVGWWGDYGWDNAFNARGQWTNGPLHGFAYLIRNRGSSAKPRYAEPVKLTAGGKPIDVFGMPSPNFADFDGDGDLDLLCGEFIDGFTYFENVGSRRAPQYAPGRRLAREGKPIRMPLCMIVPAAVDWDRDGDVDLIVGQEDGRVAFLENTGRTANGMPVFRDPRFFKQEAEAVKFGALATPACFDWDGDGDEDILCGDTAGEIGFIENLGGFPPRWAAPRRLRAGGKPIRIMAGPNGSIQGPAEAKWGYTVLSAADWDCRQLDLGSSGLVPQHRDPPPAEARAAPADPGRVAGPPAQAGVELVESGRRRVSHPMANHTGGRGLESGRNQRPCYARPRGLSGVFPTGAARRQTAVAPGREDLPRRNHRSVRPHQRPENRPPPPERRRGRQVGPP